VRITLPPGRVRFRLRLTYPVLRDGLCVALLLLALAVNVGHVGLLAWAFEGLPERLPVHVNALGQADLIAGKEYLYRLPAIPLVLTVTNLFLASYGAGGNSFVARLLVALSLWVQLLFLAATWYIVR
jgi:hypothetical protein